MLRDLAARLPSHRRLVRTVIAKTTRESLLMRRTGALARWPPWPASARPAYGASGTAHGLKPHRVETFKLSNDPRFAEKLEDIVGLYLNPPEHALVLSSGREEPDPSA